MNHPRHTIWTQGRQLVVGAVVALLLAGCGSIFVPKHKVGVDAICAAGVTKPAGKSFRLVGKRSLAGQPVNLSVVAACISAALAHEGMYEAPVIAPADLLIEVQCGQESGPRLDPSARETFLELSARPNVGKAMEQSREPEIWNVRVSIQGLSGRVENAMPLLSAVAASFAATDTKFQTTIDVPQNSATVASVRETAVKTLESRATAAGASTPAPAAAAAKKEP
jgi:hypothetical protein